MIRDVNGPTNTNQNAAPSERVVVFTLQIGGEFILIYMLEYFVLTRFICESASTGDSGEKEPW